MPSEPVQPPGAGNGTPQRPAPAPGADRSQPPRPASGGTAKVPPASKDTAVTRVLPSGKDTATTRLIPQIAAAGPKKIILVCDDVTQIRKILCFNLKSANYETLEAADGAEAIKLAETRKVDLILLDVMTPNVDGFTACGRIKANPNTKNVPIIMLTACSQKEDVIRALSNGACDYIVKPFKKETVLQKIERALAGAAAPAPPAEAPQPPSASPAHS